MSVLISNIRLPFDVPEQEAIENAKKIIGQTAYPAHIFRVSLDARHGKIHKVYAVRIDDLPQALEQAAAKLPNVQCKQAAIIQPPAYGSRRLTQRPVVIGAGPAGLFAAYILAQHGYAPLLLERGGDLDERDNAVQEFHRGGKLNTQCNIQFGEGGAGAYSDGKLTTRINDPLCEAVLQILVRHGAPAEILKQAKPHIGTDILKNVVRTIRQAIIQHGGSVQFHTQVTGILKRQNTLTGLMTNAGQIACEQAILAVGHSARDTFAQLVRDGIALQPKAFSVGVRIEHLQSDMDKMLYGKFAGHPALPPAEYTLSHREGTRACYSFCMCPGGQVVAAQSEPESIVTNGMSYHARDGKNANSALVVSVDPQDFADGSPLGGIAFQRQLERTAFAQAKPYTAPCQRVEDFLSDKPSSTSGTVLPTYPRGVRFGSITDCMPEFVCQQLKTGLAVFSRKIQGFAMPDALLTAPETRTSSPVRIPRQENGNSLCLQGLLPCGEGAGYAGGILSAAVDGIRMAYHIIEQFAPQ